MSDDLIFRVFVELAVLEKKRDVHGNWLIDDAQEIPRLLKRAFAFVSRASTAGEAEQGPGRGKK